jgi:hypothetical protein
LKTNWSDIQESKPFFWVMLKAWLKSKNAIPIIDDANKYNQYVKVRFIESEKEQELSAEMLIEMLDVMGFRLSIYFDKENSEALWGFSVWKQRLNFWYQSYVFEGYLPNRSVAIMTGIRQCIDEIDYGLSVESKEANFL